MAYQRIIRWLHLSDFHVGKDYQGQEQLFEYILAEVREKIKEKFVPDLVFITGDIANKGLGSEYRDFTNKFLRPLKAHIESELKSEDRIFLIPGNHDVSRVNDWIVRYDVLQEAPDFFDPSTQGAEHRKHLLDRFKGYTGSAMPGLTPAIKRDWLQADGFYTYTLSIHDYKIGILGLNTAWLSKGDGDRHHMSPGKPLVEKGLQELEGCHIKIVLGHHPIDWFEDDQVKPIRALLGRHNVIYLHGHLHKTGGGREEGGGNSFLPIQAGAAFQAREHEQWVNQILWCELDCDRAYLTVEPLKWSRDNQTWVINTEAFPPPYQKTRSGQKIPGKHWYLSLPFSLGEEVYEDVIDNDIVYSMPRLPEGWLYIDRLFVEKERKRKLEEEQVIRFFDGSYPSWQTILSPTIKPLSMTSILLATLEKARLKAGPGVTVLLGPGGEGKTTVLKQVVCDLVNPNSPWMVIWREDEDCEDAMNFVLELPEIDGKTWLIVADFVNNIIDEIYTTTKSLYKSGRKDIQFLLCCRDTDWNATAGGLSWTTFTMHYEKHLLNGLTDDDARKVVASWKLYGSRGLRKLADISFDEAVNRFIDEARLAAPSKEGSFLGAMLEVRFDHEGLKEHIKHVLERLEQIKIPGGTLLEAFAYIAALHAKEAELVTKETLALKLGCPSDQIKQHIIGPLGKEAALSRSGKYILTRHTKIARAAIDILAEPPFNYDMEERYIINFVRSVVHAYKLNSEPYKDDIRKWRYLSNEIFNLRRRGYPDKGKYRRAYREEERGNKDLAIRLAKALMDEDPTDGYYAVNLAQLLWRAGEPVKGAEVFRYSRKEVRKDRAYYFSWAVAEGRAGNHALDVWLCGVSLDDNIAKAAPDHERLKKSLNGLATAFDKLFERGRKPAFVYACVAAARLGLSLSLDDKTQETLDEVLVKYSQYARSQDISSSLAFHWLTEGIKAAWEQREIDLPDLLREDQLSFQQLAKRFDV